MVFANHQTVPVVRFWEVKEVIGLMKIIILSGGRGRRLWPTSRRHFPKQFIDFFGTGETLLQTAAERASRIVGHDNVLVVTNSEYTDIVREQLPWLPDNHLLAEPVHRNTAPAAAWAVHRVMIENDDNTSIVLMPADQLILHEDRFEAALRLGADFVKQHDTILTMGATPTRNEPGYGYIQTSSYLEGMDGSDGGIKVSEIKSFVEKPEREFAKMLIDSGEFLWNTGIYMARVGYFREQMKALLPTVLREERGGMEEENEFIRINYSRYPNMSLDLAILEKMPKRVVMHTNFGWADIGTWHGIYEAVPRDGYGNVMINSNSTLIAENSTGNVVYAENGKLVILSEMENYIVSDKDNVLLICPKQDSSAMVRKYLGKVENEEGMQEFY